ncbi:MAG: hypothetical protein ACOZHQ_12470 [Thermodesulfobacteriota bacterium]
MAKDSPPSARERRRLLAESPAGLGPTGRLFLDQRRWGEALECLEAAGDREGLEKLRQAALAAGDYFYWRRALAALGQAPAPAEVQALAEAAAAAGKDRFREQAASLLASGAARS